MALFVPLVVRQLQRANNAICHREQLAVQTSVISIYSMHSVQQLPLWPSLSCMEQRRLLGSRWHVRQRSALQVREVRGGHGSYLGQGSCAVCLAVRYAAADRIVYVSARFICYLATVPSPI